MNRLLQQTLQRLLAGMLMLLPVVASAQQRSISGMVSDVQGIPVIGASVVIKGTTLGTVTDMEGKFQLEAEPSQTLEVSFIGYQKVSLPVGNQTYFLITLKEDTETLDEVVVVGYATQKKVNLTARPVLQQDKDYFLFVCSKSE